MVIARRRDGASFCAPIHPTHIADGPMVPHPARYRPESLHRKHWRGEFAIIAARSSGHAVCAISEFTRQTLIDARRDAGKDHDHSPCRRSIFRDGWTRPTQHLSRHDLEPGVFFPGHTWHHKNHRRPSAPHLLRDGMVSVSRWCAPAGSRAQAGSITISTARLASVRFLGTFHRTTSARNRRCCLAPSSSRLRMPVLEAMRGCPVVCSNTTSPPDQR